MQEVSACSSTKPLYLDTFPNLGIPLPMSERARGAVLLMRKLAAEADAATAATATAPLAQHCRAKLFPALHAAADSIDLRLAVLKLVPLCPPESPLSGELLADTVAEVRALEPPVLSWARSAPRGARPDIAAFMQSSKRERTWHGFDSMLLAQYHASEVMEQYVGRSELTSWMSKDGSLGARVSGPRDIPRGKSQKARALRAEIALVVTKYDTAHVAACKLHAKRMRQLAELQKLAAGGEPESSSSSQPEAAAGTLASCDANQSPAPPDLGTSAGLAGMPIPQPADEPPDSDVVKHPPAAATTDCAPPPPVEAPPEPSPLVEGSAAAPQLRPPTAAQLSPPGAADRACASVIQVEKQAASKGPGSGARERKDPASVAQMPTPQRASKRRVALTEAVDLTLDEAPARKSSTMSKRVRRPNVRCTDLV